MTSKKTDTDNHPNINTPDNGTIIDGHNRSNRKLNRQNWYVKMHKSQDKTALSDIASQTNDNLASNNKNKRYVITSKIYALSHFVRQLNLSIFFRIWLTVALIVVIASVRVFTQLYEHVEPTSKQIIEDTLVDTSKLLAVYFSKPLTSGNLKKSIYQEQLDSAFTNTLKNSAENFINKERKFFNEERMAELSTWFHQKNQSSFRVYVTDTEGKVLYDSRSIDNAEGKDYSKWNDIYLTLQGQYGARSSREVLDVESSSVMYVAQPIINSKGELVGVVSVGKPVVTILPYLKVARQKMFSTSLFIMCLSIILAGLVAWWLKQSIMLVIRYTQSLASDTVKPNFYFGHELNILTDTIEKMKDSIENKAYVSDYVHTLTHELKSPLTAIKASGELLGDADLDEEDRLTLSRTINEQSQKLQTLIDKLLLLAKIEQPSFKLDSKKINIGILLQTLLLNHHANIQKSELEFTFFYENTQKDINDIVPLLENTQVFADGFWLSQAIDNLLSNAIYFADSEIQLHITINHIPVKILTLTLINDGNPIPDFALNKVFDKYFSLSHNSSYQQKNNPNRNTTKGTGLGLTLAKQVIEHHKGMISIANSTAKNNNDTNDIINQNKVVVTVQLPIA